MKSRKSIGGLDYSKKDCSSEHSVSSIINRNEDYASLEKINLMKEKFHYCQKEKLIFESEKVGDREYRERIDDIDWDKVFSMNFQQNYESW